MSFLSALRESVIFESSPHKKFIMEMKIWKRGALCREMKMICLARGHRVRTQSINIQNESQITMCEREWAPQLISFLIGCDDHVRDHN